MNGDPLASLYPTAATPSTPAGAPQSDSIVGGVPAPEAPRGPETLLYPSVRKATEPAAAPKTAAAALYGDALPAGLEGARFDEPAASSVTDYRAQLPEFQGTPEERANLDAGLEAALAEGLGITQMSALVKMEREAIAAGEAMSVDAGMAALRETYGERTDAVVAEARAYVAKVAERWPGVVAWLEETRLGNSPAFVRMAYERARRSR